MSLADAPALFHALGPWLGSGSHLVFVMLAAAIGYPLLGVAGRRSRDARAAREVAYVQPTIQAVAVANGATRYEVEYGKAQPIVTVTLVFPDARLSATCRDATYEEAILSALRLVVAGRNAALAAAAATATAGADRGRARTAKEPGPAPAPAAADPSRRGVIDDRTPWHEVLGVPVGSGRREVDAAFRKLAHRFHPDHGGSGEMMRHLVRARAEGVAAS